MGKKPGKKGGAFDAALAALLSAKISPDRVDICLANLFRLADGVLITKRPGGTRKAKAKPAEVEAAIALLEAGGYTIVEPGEVVYKEKPDRDANQYLIDQVHGAPKSRTEITGAGNAPLSVTLYLPKKEPLGTETK